MSPKALELRPDRRKLKSSFDGYKLCLEPVPVLKYDVPQPLRVKTSQSQFSFLHAELFGLHNHLFRDPWHPESAYFVDTAWTIQKVTYCVETGKVRPYSPVMKILRPNVESLDQRYPVTLEFVSPGLALLGDGCGTLIILETGNRQQSDEFKAKQRFEPVEGPFYVKTAHFSAEEKMISTVLIQVQMNEDYFETVVHWTRLKCCESIWSVLESKQLRTRSGLQYCDFDADDALLVVTNFPIDFLANIEKNQEEIRRLKDETEKEDIEKMEKDLCLYNWNQTPDDVTINFDMQEDASKQDYTVKVTRDKICIKYKSTILLEGELAGKIDVNATTWTLENDFLQVSLLKETEELWSHLVPGGPKDQGSCGPSAAAPAISIMESEDCDETEEEYHLSRLTWTDEVMSHQAFLGNTPPLFQVQLNPEWPKAVALKHDVDACIWQSRGADCWQHEDTVDAFGYVLASKLHKKFVACAPSVEYVVVAEPERHVFIYKKGYTGSSLRNRTGAPVNIGQQKLVSVDGHGEIIGISAQNDVTLLLTTNYLICLQLRIEE